MTDTPPPGLSPEAPTPDPAPLSTGDGGETLRFDTTLRPSSFLGLSLKNGLLNIVTLTLWRFWGKTEVRRRIWRGVRLNGDAFEYTGRGVELFIGFLLALLVLGLPFLLIVFGVQFLGPFVAPLVILPLYIFIFWLWGFGVFTAYRYMASRTTWRGIRFRLGGSARGFGLKYLGMILLSGITLGWYWPTAERELARSCWNELRFGDRIIRFRMDKAEAQGVYGPYALGWFLTLIPYILFVGVVVAFSLATHKFAPLVAASAPMEVPPAPAPPSPGAHFAMIAAVYGALLIIAPIFLLVWSPYHAAKLRSIAAGVQMDKASFRLDVRALSLWWLTITNFFFLIITLGFLMPWVQARTARYLIQRLTATGTADLESARQTTTGPGSGEGLADAFGFSLI